MYTIKYSLILRYLCGQSRIKFALSSTHRPGITAETGEIFRKEFW